MLKYPRRQREEGRRRRRRRRRDFCEMCHNFLSSFGFPPLPPSLPPSLALSNPRPTVRAAQHQRIHGQPACTPRTWRARGRAASACLQQARRELFPEHASPRPIRDACGPNWNKECPLTHLYNVLYFFLSPLCSVDLFYKLIYVSYRFYSTLMQSICNTLSGD